MKWHGIVHSPKLAPNMLGLFCIMSFFFENDKKGDEQMGVMKRQVI